MTKKEKILLGYKAILGVVDIENFKDKIPAEKIEEIKVMQKYASDIPPEMKEATLSVMEIAISTLENEKGDDYSEDELRERFVGLMLMTDPNNKISPFEINNRIKN